MGSCMSTQPIVIPEATLAREPTEEEIEIEMDKIKLEIEEERIGKLLKKLKTI